MRFCQGTKCHEYRTKDRIRGTKGKKSYQTRRRSSFYYGQNNFCSLNCQNDWLEQNIEKALNHFGSLSSTVLFIVFIIRPFVNCYVWDFILIPYIVKSIF